MTLSKEEHVWLQAWIASTNSGPGTSSYIAKNFADACLEAFRGKFSSVITHSGEKKYRIELNCMSCKQKTNFSNLDLSDFKED